MMTKNAYADNGSYRAKVVGNYKYPLKYNGKLYSLPSLLFTGTGGDLTQTGNAYFVINNGQNIPYHPAGTLSNTQTTTQVLQSITGTGNLVLTGITLPTETSDTFKTLTSTSTTIQNLQQALGITDQTQLGNVIYGSSYNTNTSVNATSGGSTTPAVGTFSLSSTTVTAGTNVTITNNCTTSPTSYTSSNTSVATISGTGITTLTAGTTNITPVGGSCSDSSAKTLTVTAPTWTQLDTNCTIPDITIGSQTWAGCNSTLGSGFERGKQDNGTNGTIGSCYDYNGNNTATCTIGSTAMASTTKANTWFTGTNTNSDSEVNNIWGKLYSWTGSTGLSANCKGGDFNASSSNSNCPCPTGRHVPTDAEFITLSTTLNGSLCETTTGWQCSGLGWMNNHTKTASNNIIQALKIPLAGFRYADGSTFGNRGYYTYLWSSSVSGTYAYSRYFYWSYDAVHRNTSNQANGFSVRCLKD
ncbi:MAG: FISUMP domain-containing protein [Candidatus Altimarinota bacterium]